MTASPSPDFDTEGVSVDPKKTYRSRRGASGAYRPVGVGEHVHSGQRQVVYRRLDTGQLLICPLVHWHDCFEEVK